MSMRLGENVLPHLLNKAANGDVTTLASTEISALVSDEKERAKEAEEAIQANLDETNQKLDKEISDRETAVTEEANSRKNADDLLTTDLASEVSNRETAITEEAEARTRADEVITASLANEANERREALNTEASERKAEDQALSEALSAEVLARENAISQEILDRNNAITAAVDSLDVEDAEVNGEFVSAVSESNGKVSIVRKNFSDTVTEGDVNAPSGNAVYQAIQALGTIYELKGSVETFESLPSEKNAGDVYNVNDTGDNYVWTGTEWDRLGGSTIVNALNAADPTASSSTSVTFISNVSQTNGQISATKKTLPAASTSVAGITKIAGSYSNTGTLPVTGTHVATAISAEADARRSAISSAISTEVVNRNNAISSAIDNLDVAATTGTAGQTITSISETDGKISATYSDISITKSQISDYSDYTLPTASSTRKGGISLGYTQTEKNYPVAVDSNGKAYVNVPWTDANDDTKNTAGSTNSASKLYLVGAGSQADNPQTYSNANVYEESGKLYCLGTGTSASQVMTKDMFAAAFSYSSGILTITI